MRICLTAAAFLFASCAPHAPTSQVATLTAAAAIDAPSGEYTLDPSHSSLHVRVSHFGLSNYTLRFTRLRATLIFSAENPTASQLVATADAASLSTDFPLAEQIGAELRGADWLAVVDHPEIEFRSTRIEPTGPSTARVHGDLTLRGVTRPMTLDVTFNAGYARHPYGRPLSQLGFSARGVISRSEFGLVSFLPSEGSPAVGDEVQVIIEAEFARPITA
jgi:polyisoprenoid-binding protein YceI